ncbi:unnamed protein product [Staurois parvus]|uniref:Uncharacterized protein n=1 Tax=Staurois parvus TaxID=386267 RepID=A0ABN9CVV2_9NEOB|nr:unnamed protein product [Staurois parvus]
MYIHTQTHVHTDTHTCTCTQTHVHTHRQMYTHTHTCRHMYRYTHVHTQRHPPPPKNLQYFVVHSQSWVLHSRGRLRAQHTLLALLSLRSAIEQSDGSQCQ